jgi:hypothetical protein
MLNTIANWNLNNTMASVNECYGPAVPLNIASMTCPTQTYTYDHAPADGCFRHILQPGFQYGYRSRTQRHFPNGAGASAKDRHVTPGEVAEEQPRSTLAAAAAHGPPIHC